MIKDTFNFTNENFSEVSHEVQKNLLQLKASKREAINALLLLEECFVQMGAYLENSNLSGAVKIK